MTPTKIIDYLINDEIPLAAIGYLKELVETFGATFDEGVPTAVVVALPGEAVHLHLVDEEVGAEDIIFFVRVLLTVLLCPGGLSTSGQTYHHYDLRKDTENIIIIFFKRSFILWNYKRKRTLTLSMPSQFPPKFYSFFRNFMAPLVFRQER